MSTLRKLRRKRRAADNVEPLRRPEITALPKLSEVILDYAKPLLDSAEDNDCQAAIDLAVASWNLSLLPERERRQMFESTAEKLRGKGGSSVVEFENLIHKMIDRKLALFPHDRRAVFKHHLIDKGDAFSLRVLWALME